MEKLIEDLFKIKKEVMELNLKASNIELTILDQLVKDKRNDLLTINWSRVCRSYNITPLKYRR